MCESYSFNTKMLGISELHCCGRFRRNLGLANWLMHYALRKLEMFTEALMDFNEAIKAVDQTLFSKIDLLLLSLEKRIIEQSR